MSSRTLAACLPQRLYEESGLYLQDTQLKEYENVGDLAVAVEDDSAVLSPKHMNIGQYYLAVIDGTPYVYRRVNDKEIEVYGMV